ncbi:hypothetical protein, partial [Bradyrhizobium japonicum]|uniref:hypothetical protein n=1 Tax=Bradyrhizobium japonicum TaxID=375 RepID=UPI001BA84E26
IVVEGKALTRPSDIHGWLVAKDVQIPAYGAATYGSRPPSETLARFLFSPPASRLLAAASLQKRSGLGCSAALRPKGSDVGRPP